MITIEEHGDFKKLNTYLERLKSCFDISILDKYGREGVEALKLATPVNSGKTAESWDYVIERSKDSVRLIWINTNIVDGTNIAILLQYGHATRSGTWIEGLDYIEPTIRPIFIKIMDEVDREVRRL